MNALTLEAARMTGPQDRNQAMPAPPDAPHVDIIVLNWNGRDDTLACLGSLRRLRYPNFSVVVVDNGSADDSCPAIRSAHPEVELIETGLNLGFAGGNNVGIRRALERGADYVLLLNNDTEVEADMLTAFVAAAAQAPDAGALSGTIYYHADPRRVWYAGAAWDEATARFRQLVDVRHDDGGAPALTDTAYACGCAFFVSAARLRQIGLLDEDFFLYFEETDWCYRARAAGHASFVVAGAKLRHKVSVSFGGEGSPLALYFLTRNRLLWVQRHGSRSQRRAVWRVTATGLWGRLVRPLGAAAAQALRSPRASWWALQQWRTDPHHWAFALGVRDYCFRRFGDCPAVVREWARRAQQQASKRAAAAQPLQREPRHPA